MNLNTITELKRPAAVEQITQWRDGYAWLAGGTWLFSEPQVATDTLIDLVGLQWPALSASAGRSRDRRDLSHRRAVSLRAPCCLARCPLFKDCCNALLASWKIWNAATVGGNICMSLPAGSMLSLTCALEATYTLWPREGAPRSVAAVDFVTGNHANILRPGELLRSIHIPAAALAKRYALRRASLTKLGRSAALLDRHARRRSDLLLTITAATPTPIQLRFAKNPSADELRTRSTRGFRSTATSTT
jgi:CO/xanthine dehydrogenase FAD-binding subunit